MTFGTTMEGKTMEIGTSTVACQYRLLEWADQIRDCQSRPNGMSVDEWCHTHDISKANYYYRLSQVRKACLDQMQKEPVHQSIVPVQVEQLQKETLSSNSSLEMIINGITLVNAPKQGVVISSPMCVKLSENKFSGGTHERRKNNHMGRADPCLPE